MPFDKGKQMPKDACVQGSSHRGGIVKRNVTKDDTIRDALTNLSRHSTAFRFSTEEATWSPSSVRETNGGESWLVTFVPETATNGWEGYFSLKLPDNRLLLVQPTATSVVPHYDNGRAFTVDDVRNSRLVLPGISWGEIHKASACSKMKHMGMDLATFPSGFDIAFDADISCMASELHCDHGVVSIPNTTVGLRVFDRVPDNSEATAS